MSEVPNAGQKGYMVMYALIGLFLFVMLIVYVYYYNFKFLG